MKGALEETGRNEGLYSLLSAGKQARAALRVLSQAATTDAGAAAAHARLHRLPEGRTAGWLLQLSHTGSAFAIAQ